MGQTTGKAIVSFDKEESVQAAINKYDNQAVEDIINLVRPFYQKKKETPRQEKGKLNRRVYLMNLPYDATKGEIERLVKEFAEIDEVAIPRQRLVIFTTFDYLQKRTHERICFCLLKE